MEFSKTPPPPIILLEEFSDSARPMVIHQEAEAHGFHLLVSFLGEKKLPKGVPIEGALLKNGSPLVKECLQRNIPCVQLGVSLSKGEEGVPSVSVDQSICGYTGAQYFINHHFKTLAYVGNENWKESEKIHLSFSSTASEVGITSLFFRLKELKGVPDQHFLENAKAFKTWISDLQSPVGILAYNDRVASRVIALCSHLGLRVPQDVSVLGIGNSFFHCETAPVKISSIHLPWGKMWREGFSIIKLLLDGEKLNPRPLLVPPGNVAERESTDVLPIEDHLVSKAIAFIWDRYDKDISIDDFIKSEKISRSTVQRRFQKSLGRGFNEELGRKRLDVAQKFLINTDLTVNEISSRVGFNSRYYFHRSFKKAFDMTPQEYRSINQL